MTEYEDNKKSELKEGELYNLVIPVHAPELNKELLWEIEESLGEVTDLEIIPLAGQKHFNFQLNYKSNGVLKSDYLGDLKPIIACLYYVGELNSPMKKYKNSDKKTYFKTI